MLELSVVVPVYGCRDCLAALHERLTAAVETVTDSYELVFVDDRSPDGAWAALEELAARDDHVRAFRLSRNFGQHLAITAGLAHSEGRWTVVMDCDLQEPPELIPRLYQKAHEGFDIVLTTRAGRSESWFRRVAAQVYLRLRNFVLGTDVGTDHGTLSILNRKAVEAYLSIRDREREYILALYWLGFAQATVEFDQADRHSGESSYSLKLLFRVAVDGLFFQTTKLLRWVVYAGFALAFVGVLLATYVVGVYLLAEQPPPGYTSLAVLLLLLTGFVIASLGVMGLYIGRIFEQGKGRPLYIIDSYAGSKPAQADRPMIETVSADR